MNNLKGHHHHMVGHMSNSRSYNKDRKKGETVRKRKQLVKPSTTSTPSIRVRLDHRTIITLRPTSLEFWRQRYPNLTVIDQ